MPFVKVLVEDVKREGRTGLFLSLSTNFCTVNDLL